MVKFTKAANGLDYKSTCGRFYITHPKSFAEPCGVWGLCDNKQFNHWEASTKKSTLVHEACEIIKEEKKNVRNH